MPWAYRRNSTGFGRQGWHVTEKTYLASAWWTVRSFFFGTPYLYMPVSPLYVYGRHQDFALQKSRGSIDRRAHLRLWLTPLRFEGRQVWIGQVNRDIGVRVTWRTWNLTTHRIDPDVDEAREFVTDDLVSAQSVTELGFVEGVGTAPAAAP